MSSPACADGYDTPAQQREDSTTFMLSKGRSDVTTETREERAVPAAGQLSRPPERTAQGRTLSFNPEHFGHPVVTRAVDPRHGSGAQRAECLCKVNTSLRE